MLNSACKGLYGSVTASLVSFTLYDDLLFSRFSSEGNFQQKTGMLILLT
jgi:hypothetical protein